MSERLKTVLLCTAISAGVSGGMWRIFEAIEEDPLVPEYGPRPVTTTVTDAPALGFGQRINAKSVTAELFIVVDADGNPRALFGMNVKRDQANLSLGDSAGNARVSLGFTEEDEPLFSLGGKDGAERLRLVIVNDQPYQAFFDAEGTGRIGLGITDQNAALGLMGVDSGNEACLMMKENNACLYFMEKGVSRMALGHTTTTEKATGRSIDWTASTLHLFGEDGLVIWRAP